MTKGRIRPVLTPGGKLEKLYNWLKNEIVGPSLLFTVEHVSRLMTELPAGKQEYVWNSLQDLEKKGLISRTKISGEKGIIVSFIEKDPTEPTEAIKEKRTYRRRKKLRPKKTQSTGQELSVRELMEKLNARITQLEAELVEKRALLKSLTLMIKG